MKSLPRWDLTPIYPGPESPEFLADIELIRTKSAELEARLADEKSDLQTNIEAFELILDHMGNLGSYTHALVSTDTTNAVYLKAFNQVEDLLLVLKPLSVRFMRHLAKREDEIKDRGADDPYAYVLQGLLIEQKHLMSDELEEFAADLARSSWDAFSRLQQSLGSSISAEWEDGRMKTVVELRNMATDGDRAIRKRAFEKELELLEIHEEAFAAALNGVKGATISLNARRGWGSPLERSIFQSRIDSEILSALIATLEEAVPLFRSYLKKKAELLGLENLAFYDLFAPVGKSAKRYSYEDAQAFIVEHFSRFSEAMGKFAQNAFEKNWIDPEPRKGKVGGAYDTSFPVAKESRILSNFDYTYSGVSTIAHELGHAYHDSKVMQRGGLLANYPMPLAETASIFCEGLIFRGALEEADEEERIALIEAFLQDSTQVCLDILSRFYFEEEVFKRRKEGDITASELNEMMLDAQKRTYGPALDVYHPYMWAVKCHYYRPEFSHYNYPYAFGQLFGLGLSKRSEDDPSAFVEQYDALLSVSGMKSVRDVGLEAGIDLGDRSFWQEGIEVIARYVEEFKSASPH